MKKFVFLIPRTPSAFRNPLRNRLWDICLESLKNQTSNNWQALIVGEEEKVEGPFVYFQSEATHKGGKLKAALAFIEAQNQKPEYLIRLDDDDVISRTILESIDGLDFDCYTDLWQTQMDLLTGKTIQNKFPWMPNSTIHRYDIALTIGENGYTVVGEAHTNFHKYYQGKKVLYAAPSAPVYLRVLSPSCVSAGGPRQSKEGVYDLEKYRQFTGTYQSLRKLNFWRRGRKLKGFSEILEKLSEAAGEFFPQKKSS